MLSTLIRSKWGPLSGGHDQGRKALADEVQISQYGKEAFYRRVSRNPHWLMHGSAEKKLKKQLANGLDPSAVKQEIKQERILENASTFEVIAREWHEHK